MCIIIPFPNPLVIRRENCRKHLRNKTSVALLMLNAAVAAGDYELQQKLGLLIWTYAAEFWE